SWFGRTDAQFRDASGPRGESFGVVELDVAVTGTNRIRLPNFCGPSDPGPEGTVDSDTTFTLLPYNCQQTSGGCTASISIESGTGSLAGRALTVGVSGHTVQQARRACVAVNQGFTITPTR